MHLQKKLKNKHIKESSITDLYAARPGELWRAFKAQHISFWCLCFYYFIEYVRLQTTYPSLDFLPWGELALLATLISAFLNPSIKKVSNPLNNFFILFCIIIVISGVMAFMPSASWDESNTMLGWFLVYFLTISIVNTEKKLVIFLLAYLLFNFKMSQSGAYTWAMRGFSFSGWGLIGAPGWFRNSGEYAIQMLIYGSLATAYVFALKDYWGRYKRWFFYVAAATGYMAVMGASSRGSQLGLVAIGIWLALRHKQGLKGLVLIIIVGMALFLILPDKQLDRFREMGTDLDSLQRLAYWQYALSEVIPEYPVLGLGYHNWLEYVSFKVPEGLGPYMIVQGVHNIFLQVASELGVIGLLCFLLLILYAFIVNARTRKMAKCLNNKLLYSLPYGLDAGLIGYLVAGSFVTVLYYPFFWIQITMIVMVNNVTCRQYDKKFTGNLIKKT